MKTAAEVRKIIQENNLKDKQEEIESIIKDLLSLSGKATVYINLKNREEILLFFKMNGYTVKEADTKHGYYQISALLEDK